ANYDRDDGVPYEENLEGPTSYASKRADVINDKILTRILMKASGVLVPATLAFLMPLNTLLSNSSLRQEAQKQEILLAPLSTQNSQKEIRRSVETFLQSHSGQEVVIKPSGAQWHSGKGVGFFKRDQIDEMVQHVLALSPQVFPNEAILVEERVDSIPTEPAWADWKTGKKSDSTFRSFAENTPWGEAVSPGKAGRLVRTGPWGIPNTAEPPSGDPREAARIVSHEEAVKDLPATPQEIEEFNAALDQSAVTALKVINAYEATLPRQPGEPFHIRTNFITVDALATRRGGKIVPVVVEVNDHDSGGQSNIDSWLPPEDAGKHSRALVPTELQEARRHLAKGKTILIVGAGYEGKKPLIETARKLGVKVVLVGLPNTWAQKEPGLVEHYIPIDTTDLVKGPQLALEAVQKLGIPIDGVWGYWEDDVVLAAKLAKALGKPFNDPEAVTIARSKYLTYKRLREAGLPIAEFAKIDSESDLEDAIAQVGFPAVLKPEFGAEAYGNKRVNNAQELRAAYRAISPTLNQETDPIYAQGNQMVLMQYLDGQEVDVDNELQKGQVVGVPRVTDNDPTHEPYFQSTGFSMPSRLPHQEQADLIDLNLKGRQAIGLTEGSIHGEMKLTSRGPRIVEFNPRLAGSYIPSATREVWGVDPAEEDIMRALGIPIAGYSSPTPRTNLRGRFIIPKTLGTMISLSGLEELKKDPTIFEAKLQVDFPFEIRDLGQKDVRVALIIAKGSTPEEADQNLQKALHRIKTTFVPAR
ncbi:MAG: ATP-grasp domain-containing protein, partial [Elusimicrobia bacterium]|nr:ATP-grasp domain-containing protein [Elusimicrobiota bacterium]